MQMGENLESWESLETVFLYIYSSLFSVSFSQIDSATYMIVLVTC